MQGLGGRLRHSRPLLMMEETMVEDIGVLPRFDFMRPESASLVTSSAAFVFIDHCRIYANGRSLLVR